MRTYVPVNYPIPPAQPHEGPPNPQPPPPPSLPSPIPNPPKALRQTQSSRAPFYPFFPRAHYIKRHKMNVLVLSFAVSDTSSYPPPRTPTLFRSPQARDNMHRITTTASHNKHGKPKTAIPTNQPANGKPKCPVNRECMPRQPPSPPPPAKKPNADPQPTDYIPRLKKKQEQQVGAAYAHPSPPRRTSLAPQKIYFSAPRPPFPPETTS